MTAEDRIHVAVLLALCAANVIALSRGPSAGSERARAAQTALAETAGELSRAELDAAIEQLRAWLERSRAETLIGSEQEAALRGLGPNPEDRANPERWLARWVGPDLARAALTQAPPADPELRTEIAAALVILLEAGVPINQPLTVPAGELAPGPQLGELVQRLLDTEPERAELTSPWQLDLLALAVLGGMSQYEARLAHATRRELRRLDQSRRSGDLHPGSGAPSPAQLEAWATAWRAEPAGRAPGAVDLHWSAAVFRATAIASEPPLTTAARQHQLALLGRYRAERALYRYLEATAGDEGERTRVQLAALEHLGRFEEALYSAQISFRRGPGGGSGSETARVMRQAAGELIQRWRDLEASSLTERGALGPQQRAQLLRAAVQALRGLRVARAAG